LDVARGRPVLDRTTVRRGKNKGKAIARLRPATRARLEKLGWERALVYKTFLLTGLRKSELASLEVGQLKLDGPMPFATLEAADTKSRSGSEIPLRNDLAEDLRPVACRQASGSPGGSAAAWGADTGKPACKCPGIQCADRTASDSESRFEGRRHPQAG
jgi:hypothetical protein